MFARTCKHPIRRPRGGVFIAAPIPRNSGIMTLSLSAGKQDDTGTFLDYAARTRGHVRNGFATTGSSAPTQTAQAAHAVGAGPGADAVGLSLLYRCVRRQCPHRGSGAGLPEFPTHRKRL